MVLLCSTTEESNLVFVVTKEDELEQVSQPQTNATNHGQVTAASFVKRAVLMEVVLSIGEEIRRHWF